MAIRFASAVSFRTPEKFAAKFTAEELSTAQNLSNVNMLKKEAVLKKKAYSTAKKRGTATKVLKISAVDEIVNNTVDMWLLKNKAALCLNNKRLNFKQA